MKKLSPALVKQVFCVKPDHSDQWETLTEILQPFGLFESEEEAREKLDPLRRNKCSGNYNDSMMSFYYEFIKWPY